MGIHSTDLSRIKSFPSKLEDEQLVQPHHTAGKTLKDTQILPTRRSLQTGSQYIYQQQPSVALKASRRLHVDQGRTLSDSVQEESPSMSLDLALHNYYTNGPQSKHSSL